MVIEHDSTPAFYCTRDSTIYVGCRPVLAEQTRLEFGEVLASSGYPNDLVSDIDLVLKIAEEAEHFVQHIRGELLTSARVNPIEPLDMKLLFLKNGPQPDIKALEPKEIIVLAPITARLQTALKKQNIPSLACGGVAVDLLAQQTAGHQTRLHKDIDLMVSRNQLWAIDDAIAECGLNESITDNQLSADNRRDINLRTFETEDGIRVDIMGYYSISNPTVGDFPLMSWGRIDLLRPPIEIDLVPVTVEVDGFTIEVLQARSLMNMKLAQDSRFDYTRELDKQRDLELLSKLTV